MNTKDRTPSRGVLHMRVGYFIVGVWALYALMLIYVLGRLG